MKNNRFYLSKRRKNYKYKIIGMMFGVILLYFLNSIHVLAMSSDYSLISKSVTLDGKNDEILEVSFVSNQGREFLCP